MTHVEPGDMQAYLDGEVPAHARAQIESHINGCAPCAAELAQLRSAASLFATAMAGVDVPAPSFAAMAAVRAADRLPPRRLRVPLARAAMLLLGFGAVASATIPGSPVRAWIADAIRGIAGAEEEVVAPPAPSEPAPVAEPAPPQSAALAIEPVDGRVRVILREVSADAVITVNLVDTDRAVVQASGTATTARFTTGPGRLEVVGVQGGQVVIELPRSATDARVEVDGKTIYPR